MGRNCLGCLRGTLVVFGIAFLHAYSLMTVWPQSSLAGGEPEILKFRFPDAVMAGEPVTVCIRVKGSSGEVAEPVPFDGVLVIDQSGSMGDNDPENKRLDAAESFVDCVAARTRLGIVKYADSASVELGLTSDKTQLHSKLDELRGQHDGSTNMYQAMEEAQNLLAGSGQTDWQWYIILLTDGWDNSGHPDSDFYVKAQEAEGLGIVYYNVALGSQANFGLLYMISHLTGGQAFFSPDPSGLMGLYSTICQETSRLVKTREIVLSEKLNTSGQPCVRVVPGTISTSIESVTDSQKQEFEQTGQITAVIGTLGEDQEATLSFDVISDCLGPDAGHGTEVVVDIDDPGSTVQYTFGLSHGSKSVPQASFLCRTPGEPRIVKIFDPTTMELRIQVTNNWLPDPAGLRDYSLKDLVIIDQPSCYFQPKRGSAVPTEDGFFPFPQADILAWRIPWLGPKETVELKTILESTLCSAQYQPPLYVDAEKSTGGISCSYVYFTSPDGQRKTQNIPNITTTLSQVETCEGRYDLSLQPAYSIDEYRQDLAIQPKEPWNVRYVHPRDETHSLFVDCDLGNGLWNGDIYAIHQFIGGATIPQDTSAIQGQGDILRAGATNVIYVKIANPGIVPSPHLPGGVSLQVSSRRQVHGRPPSLPHWVELARIDIPAIPPHERVYVKAGVSIRLNDYVQPYTLSLEDVLLLLGAPPLVGHVSCLSALDGKLKPEDVRTCLSSYPATLQVFDDFMAQHPDICWGKSSIRVRAVVSSGPEERHTNDNSTTEVFLFSLE